MVWNVKKMAKDEYRIIDGKYFIASTCATMESGKGFDYNAHLIAAAPELLAACKLAIQALKNVRANGETAYLPIIKQGEQAISKAEKEVS